VRHVQSVKRHEGEEKGGRREEKGRVGESQYNVLSVTVWRKGVWGKWGTKEGKMEWDG
jgi:hypothetical protein